VSGEMLEVLRQMAFMSKAYWPLSVFLTVGYNVRYKYRDLRHAHCCAVKMRGQADAQRPEVMGMKNWHAGGAKAAPFNGPTRD